MTELHQALLACYGAEKLAKIVATRVGIAGAGGLGSNCAAFLVRGGFRDLKIYDFDQVSASNLNRQFYFRDQIGMDKVDALRDNLLRIDPELKLTSRKERITAENAAVAFADRDIVIEAFDSAEAKKILAEAYMGSGKLYISATGLAGWGDSDALRVRKIRDRFFLVGDLVSEVGPTRPPCAPRVNIAAAKEADIALAWVLDEKA